MRFESRTFKLAKDVGHPEEDQDVCRIDGRRGLAVVADGVASAIFSRSWATILCDALIQSPPSPDEPESFARWLADCRDRWESQIDESRLSWFQKPKLPQGAFSTLVWLELTDADRPDAGANDKAADKSSETSGYRAWAIGDSCMFHLRDGETLRMFPSLTLDDLQRDPLALGSVDLGRDAMIAFQSCAGRCRAGDLFVLCSDAVVGYVLREEELGREPPWQRWWDEDPEAWKAEILELREQRQLPHDDTTVVLLRLRHEPAERADSEPPTSSVETSEADAANAEAAPTTEPPEPAKIIIAQRVVEPEGADAYAIADAEPTLESPQETAGDQPADETATAASDDELDEDEYGLAEPDEPTSKSADEPAGPMFQPWRSEDDEPLAPPPTHPPNPFDFDLTDGEQWKQRLQQWSEEVNRHVSEGLDRGLKKMKEARRSAESAWQRYLDRFRSDD